MDNNNSKSLPTPPTRASCIDGPRPCPHTGCRYHLVPVAAAKWKIPEPSCTLDVADAVAAGEVRPSLVVIGQWLGVSHERVRQIEHQAYEKVWHQLRARGVELPEQVTFVRSDAHQERIADILRKSDDWVPLGTLAERLQLSRGGVRGLIYRMRAKGHKIEGRRGAGYRWGAP